MRSLLPILLVCTLAATYTFAKTAPVWPTQYHLNGTFSLPYFNISIPMDINYDADTNMETLSYYHGMDTYVWRFDIETLYEVVPRIDDLTCFVSSGIGSGPMINILPNLTSWTYTGSENVDGYEVDSFSLNVTTLNKTSVYAIYVTDDTPIMMVLKGYDFIFGSHPDVYVFEFDVYEPNMVNSSAFEMPELCSNNTNNNTEAGTLRSKAYLAQISVFTPPKSADPFDLYMSEHKKWYTNTEEYHMRRQIWQKNLDRIEEHNAKPDATFKMAMNHLGDYTDDEIQMLLMPKRAPGHVSSATHTHKVSGQPLPDMVDWIAKGAVTSVKDQGICGSCWTFGTAGSIEGAWFLSSGDLLHLSEQQILDCAWGEWDSGCDGGEADTAMQWIMDNGGMATERAYPYMSTDHFCAASERGSGVRLTGYANVTGGELALQDAVATKGPVAIAIDAAHPEFEYYSSGVYYNPACKNGTDDLDHEVLIVGYGTENGQDYWLVKNSWSTHWGNNGYIKMSRNRDNNCGIATDPNYPIV